MIEQLDLLKGGQERSTLEIADRLRTRGLDVTIVTARVANLPSDCKVRIINLDLSKPSGVIRYLRFLRATQWLIGREKYDIIHALTPIPQATVYQPRGGLIQETFERNLARRQGFPRLIRRLVGPNFRQRLVRHIEGQLAQQSDCTFLAVSDYVRRQCLQHLNLPESRVHTVFNGIDLARLPESADPQPRAHMRSLLGIRENQLAGVFIATSFKLKGLPVVIETASLMRQQHPDLFGRFKFIVAGPDHARPFFERLRELQMQDAFVFTGPTREVAGLLKAADFLIHPTWYDPCSRVVLEALACGTPAITTRFNGAGEILLRDECGFVAEDSADPQSFMEFMLRFLDPGLLDRFGRNGLALRPRISMEHHADQLVEFYEKIWRKIC